jgi:hypothetical protein
VVTEEKAISKKIMLFLQFATTRVKTRPTGLNGLALPFAFISAIRTDNIGVKITNVPGFPCPRYRKPGLSAQINAVCKDPGVRSPVLFYLNQMNSGDDGTWIGIQSIRPTRSTRK